MLADIKNACFVAGLRPAFGSVLSTAKMGKVCEMAKGNNKKVIETVVYNKFIIYLCGVKR